MTENFELLEYIHSLIAELEEMVAISNTISGGIVTDPETVREYAARSGAMFATMLSGHQSMLTEGVPGQFVSDMFDTIYKD